MRLAISIVLCALAFSSGSQPIDPAFQIVQLPQSGPFPVAFPHGTTMVTSTLGTNYWIIGSRLSAGPSITRVLASDITQMSAVYFDQNDFTACMDAVCVVGKKAYFVSGNIATSAPYPTNMALLSIDPDTMATNIVCQVPTNVSAGMTGLALGSIATDGTNIYYAGTGVIAFSTNGSILWNTLPNPASIGDEGTDRHACAWDGTNIWATSNYGTGTRRILCPWKIDPASGAITVIQFNFTNAMPNLGFLGHSVKLTDDMCATNGFVIMGDEGNYVGADKGRGFLLVYRTDGAQMMLCTGITNAANFGVWTDGANVWGVWNTGLVSKFRLSDLNTGIVRIDVFRLNYLPVYVDDSTPFYPINEFAQNGNTFLFTTWEAGVSQAVARRVVKTSRLTPYATVWSTTNGVLGAQQPMPFAIQ